MKNVSWPTSQIIIYTDNRNIYYDYQGNTIVKKCHIVIMKFDENVFINFRCIFTKLYFNENIFSTDLIMFKKY